MINKLYSGTYTTGRMDEIEVKISERNGILLFVIDNELSLILTKDEARNLASAIMTCTKL